MSNANHPMGIVKRNIVRADRNAVAQLSRFGTATIHEAMAEGLGKAFGIVALIVGLAWIVGALAGGTRLDQPLSALAGGTRLDQPLSPFTGSPPEAVSQVAPLPMTTVTTLESLENALRDSQKPVFIDVYADWCVSCKEMEKFTFADAKVAAQKLLCLDDEIADAWRAVTWRKRAGHAGLDEVIAHIETQGLLKPA